LAFEKMQIVVSNHPGNIFHDERLWFHQTERPDEFSIQKIDVALWVPDSSLAEALARIASY
jgi:hypothetical protein